MDRKRQETPPLSPFEWGRCVDGYRWIEGDIPLDASRGSGRALRWKRRRRTALILDDVLPKGATRQGVRLESYEPLVEPTSLWREFSRLQPTAVAILAFAKKYGPLGTYRGRYTRLTSACGYAGTLEEWSQEIVAMRRAAEAWDLARSSNRAKLRAHVRWERSMLEKKTQYYALYFPDANEDGSHFRRFFLHHDKERSTLVGRGDEVDPGDLTMPAFFYVEDVVNNRLAEHTQHRLVWDLEKRVLRLMFVPKNLLGAIWLLFARAISRSNTHHHCRVCRTPIEIGPNAKRADARYCSSACRTRAYQRRLR